MAAGASSGVPLLIGTTRDESAFFALGSPALQSLDLDGLRRWMRRVTPDPAAADEVIGAVRAARSARGESTEPRDLWSAIATEYVFRVGSLRLADAHAGSAAPGVGTFCYLFTWESPAFGGVLGSCHALEIPFVFGTVKSPMVQGFSGGGDEALALSAAIRRSWTHLRPHRGAGLRVPAGRGRRRGRSGTRPGARPPCSARGRVPTDWSTGSTTRGESSGRRWTRWWVTSPATARPDHRGTGRTGGEGGRRTGPCPTLATTYSRRRRGT